MAELKPGRELDALIAEEVMGYNVMRTEWDAHEIYTEQARSAVPCPNYSASIEAAWQVVQKLSKEGWHFRIEIDADGELFSVSLFRNERDGQSEIWAGNAPEAICLAALKALGVENGG